MRQKKNVLDLAYEDTRLHRASRREMAGPCPRPGCRCQRDGFHVDPERNPVRRFNRATGEFEDDDSQPPRGGFMCRGCWDPQEIMPDGKRRGWGDVIDYLRHMRGLSFREAQALIMEDENADRQPSPPRQPSNHHRHASEQADTDRSEQWQEETLQALREHQERLWDSRDTTALDYARSRGLSDDIIRNASLGYSLAGGIPRLVIPSINQQRFVAMYRRDLRPDVSKDQRWRDAPGSRKDELYLADGLRDPRPTVLVEGPLDALTIYQECGHLVNVVATGGVSGARSADSLERLKAMPLVLVIFDSDAGGDQEAGWWLSRLPNARRERPLSHDINEMLMQGYDLTAWLESLVDVCCVCRRPLADSVEDLDLQFHYDGNGRLYCQDHWKGYTSASNSLSPEEREPIPSAESEPDDVQEPSAEDKQASLQSLQAFAERLNAEVFSMPCKIAINPPGFTIEDRVRELQAERAEAWQQAREKRNIRPPETEKRRKRREAKEAAQKQREKEHREFLDAQAEAPRVYPAPFPDYALREVDGVKKLVQIGMHGTRTGVYWTMEEWNKIQAAPLVQYPQPEETEGPSVRSQPEFSGARKTEAVK